MNQEQHRLEAIAIALDAQSIQRRTETEFLVSAGDVSAMTAIPIEAVRDLGSRCCHRIQVAGRDVGYFRDQFRVADSK